MKRILFFLLFLSMLPLAVSASELIDGIYYNLDVNTKTAKVVYQRNYHYSGDVVIPSSVTYEGVDYSVTQIGDAFRGSTDLTSLTIPASVTSIGVGIFGSCTSLTSLIIEEGNPVYDSRENCNAVIETANNTLLSGCTGTIVPNSVTSIGGKAFSGCTGLTSVNIPNSVTSIGSDAFKDCDNLKKVIINNNAIVSEDNHNGSPTPITRYFGTQVEEYVLGEDVTSIGYEAFYNCGNLTSIQMSNSVTTIGEGAFQDCHNLTSVIMSDNLTSIGRFAFQNCYKLASITIPRGVTDIEWVFGGCGGFTKVVINSNAIMSKEYYAGSSLSRYFGYQVKEYVLGEEVTTIGNYAFYGCGGLTSINIPKNVTSIGENAFRSCIGLTAIQVESGNTVYDSREDCNAIIETASNTLLYGCKNTVIPNSVTGIGEYAFGDCQGLTSVNIPNSVTNIGPSAFTQCYELTSVTIPNSVTTIGYYAFSGCPELATVVIGNGITNVEKGAFYGCSHMTDMYCYAEKVPELGDEVFQFSINNATLHVPESSLEAYSNAEQWKDFKEIVALTGDDPKPTGIMSANRDVMTVERYYTIDGKHTITPQRGLNIIRMSDGTTKKIVIK